MGGVGVRPSEDAVVGYCLGGGMSVSRQMPPQIGTISIPVDPCNKTGSFSRR